MTYIGFVFMAIGLFGMGFFVGRYVEAVRAHRAIVRAMDEMSEVVQREREKRIWAKVE